MLCSGSEYVLQWRCKVYAVALQSIYSDTAKYMQWHCNIYAVILLYMCSNAVVSMGRHCEMYAVARRDIRGCEMKREGAVAVPSLL